MELKIAKRRSPQQSISQKRNLFMYKRIQKAGSIHPGIPPVDDGHQNTIVREDWGGVFLDGEAALNKRYCFK